MDAFIGPRYIEIGVMSKAGRILPLSRRIALLSPTAKAERCTSARRLKSSAWHWQRLRVRFQRELYRGLGVARPSRERRRRR